MTGYKHIVASQRRFVFAVPSPLPLASLTHDASAFSSPFVSRASNGHINVREEGFLVLAAGRSAGWWHGIFRSDKKKIWKVRQI